MKIEMLTAMAGSNFSLVYGEIVEQPKDIAEEWIKAGIAREVPEGKKAAAQEKFMLAQIADLTAENNSLKADKEALLAQISALMDQITTQNLPATGAE